MTVIKCCVSVDRLREVVLGERRQKPSSVRFYPRPVRGGADSCEAGPGVEGASRAGPRYDSALSQCPRALTSRHTMTK